MPDNFSSLLHKILSQPFTPEMNLAIPEESLFQVVQYVVEGKVNISDFSCRDGYISCNIKKGILPHLDVRLGIKEVILNSKQFHLILTDLKGNISKLISILNTVGLNIPVKIDKNRVLCLDLSQKLQQLVVMQPKDYLALLDALCINVIIAPKELRLHIAVQH